MNQKNKLLIVGVIFGVSILALGLAYLFRNNFEAVQTSLVKYYNGANYQCVAYVERYYQNMFGIKIQNVGNAMNLAKKASKYGLYFHQNGGVVIPQVGDVLVFGNKNKVGHVAIITGVLKDGVLIVEQNWHKAKITNNHGKILPAEYQNGKYTIADRYYSKTSKDKFWIMGWVSRTKQNPGTFFNFSKDDDQGWLLENGLKKIVSKDEKALTMKVIGKEPRFLSPVFLDGLNFKKYNKFVFAAKVKGNNKSTGGVLYLRDGSDKWSQQIPFTVNYLDEDFKTITINLKSLPANFKITQFMLRLTNSGVRYGREMWLIDWARVGDRKTDIL